MTRDLKKLEDWVDRRLWLGVTRTERKILINYKIALDEIRKELSKVYEKYAKGGVLTHAEMTKYHRLKNLHDQITGIMGPTLSKNGKLIERLSEVQYEESFYLHAWAIDQSTGVSARWGLVSEKMIEQAVKAPEWRSLQEIAIRTLKQDAIVKMDRTIAQGLIQGFSYEKMAKTIKVDVLEKSAAAARRIAQTEGHRAMVLGQLDNYAKAEDLGLELKYVWDATLDDRTRPSHAEMDGKVADENGMFHTSWGLVSGPGLEGPPEEVINCFPGDTVIYGQPQKVYRRWYEGKLITLMAAVGTRLSVTPNHPILTGRGWLPAKAIQKGDYIICGRFGKPMSLVDGDVQRMPTSIENVFMALSQSRLTERMIGADTQFHGDGMSGDVDVVFADRQLGLIKDSTDSEPSTELEFAFANYTAPSMRSENQLLFGPLHSAHGSMGSSGEPGTLGGAGLRHSDKHGLTAITDGDSILDKNTSDNLPADMETFGKLLNRDGLFGIEFCEVSSIDNRDFSGHVYNLQTPDGYYYAQNPENVNGIMAIVANCRCRVTGEIAGYEPKTRWARNAEGKGELVEWTTFKDWAQERGLSKNIYGKEYR